MPFKLTVNDADEHYQDYEWPDALREFFSAVAAIDEPVGDIVSLQYEADQT